jgi:carbohydrate kinase (thermoresistant glucokinase family)
LAATVGGSFVDADDFHSSSNLLKMSRGIPLTDGDRKPWLAAINQHLRNCPRSKPIVLACSALRQHYREQLAAGLTPENLCWVFLTGDFHTIQQRMANRVGHFMSQELLQSQFNSFEPPAEGLVLDVGRSVDELVAAIVAGVFN